MLRRDLLLVPIDDAMGVGYHARSWLKAVPLRRAGVRTVEIPISLQCSEGGVEGVVNMPEAKGVFGRVDSQPVQGHQGQVLFVMKPTSKSTD